MEERIVRSLLGYVKWLKVNDGVTLEGWKVVERDGVVGLEHEAENLRLRGEMVKDNKPKVEQKGA